MLNCPKCGSQYVASKGTREEADGLHHRYYCEACRNKFDTVDRRQMASGKWLITFDNSGGYEYIEVYRGYNGELNVNLREYVDCRTRYRSGKSTLSFYVVSSTLAGKPSSSVFVKSSICNQPLLITGIKMNEELTALALKNSAMKMTWENPYPRAAPEMAYFYVGNFTGEQINHDMCKFYVEAIGDGAKIKEQIGCYVATAVYGSYDCPQVWTLRRFRDYTLAKSWYGRAFIKTYYAISPTLVKWFGHTNWFKNMWRGTLDRMVSNLNAEGIENTPYQDQVW